jgi:arylsulfatase A-like enzyme
MRQAPRSLVLVTVDCMRADHVGFLGYQRFTTPFLDSLAGQSLVFRNAIAAGAPTYYSVPAILASRYPLGLGRDLLGLAPDESTITSVLKECGFQTAAFLAANPYLSERFGYHQGFDIFRDFLDGGLEFSLDPATQGMHIESNLRSRTNRALSRVCHNLPGAGPVYDELYFQYCQKFGATNHQSLDSLRRFPSADVIVDHAITWLKQNSGSPFFLWLHLMDPHSPYFPKQEALDAMGAGDINATEARYLNSYWARGDVAAKRLQKKRERVVALYDAGIRWADAQIRRLTEKLVDLNLWNTCALAVTADHGEQFLEQGQRFHPPVKLNEELIRVPLLVRVPDFPSGDFESPLGLIDLAPTLLDILNIPAPASFRGRSCGDYLACNQPWDRVVVTECVSGCTNPFYAGNRMGPRILAVRMGRFKLVIDFAEVATSEQLFDLTSDPHERSPLSPGIAESARRHLLACARKHLTESRKSPDIEARLYTQLRDLRLEWAQSTANTSN